jgi:hypothetical protein
MRNRKIPPSHLCLSCPPLRIQPTIPRKPLRTRRRPQHQPPTPMSSRLIHSQNASSASCPISVPPVPGLSRLRTRQKRVSYSPRRTASIIRPFSLTVSPPLKQLVRMLTPNSAKALQAMADTTGVVSLIGPTATTWSFLSPDASSSGRTLLCHGQGRFLETHNLFGFSCPHHAQL